MKKIKIEICSVVPWNTREVHNLHGHEKKNRRVFFKPKSYEYRRVQQLLTFRRCFLSLVFLLPWALCLQKAINMRRWQEMSVGFECWRVVVNIPDEGGWDEVCWSPLKTCCCFDLLFKISWVLFQTLRNPSVEKLCICRARRLRCTREYI